MKMLRHLSRIAAVSIVASFTLWSLTAATSAPSSNGAAPTGKLTTGAVMGAFPKGVILPWYPGPTDRVPVGWALCDGRHGTPDLQGRYLVGADNFTDVTLLGKPVGQADHRHHIDLTATGTGATGEQNTDSNWSAGPGHTPPEATGTHHKHPVSVTVPISGDTLPASNLPPSMKVQYIIKL